MDLKHRPTLKDPKPAASVMSQPSVSAPLAPHIKTESSDQQQRNGDIHTSFNRADGYINTLASQVLPTLPHLLSVPTTTPFRPEFPYENRNTPFADWEVGQMQYMTLLSYHERGVARPRGDWEGEMVGVSPESGGLRISPEEAGRRSGTATPRSERDPNRVRTKISLADYKSGKRPPTQPKQPADDDVAGPPLKDVAKVIEPQNNAIAPPRKVHPLPAKVEILSSGPESSLNGAKIPRSIRDPVESQTQLSDPSLKPSETRSNSSNTASEKRQSKKAAEIVESRENIDNLDLQNLSKPSAKDHPKKEARKAKHDSEPMPPMLSPLPARLTSPERPNQSTPSRSHTQKPVTSTKSPEEARKSNAQTPPLSPCPMPPLLSPTLPPHVERWLARSKANSLEGLHERSRDPDTPGVARKVKPASANDRQRGARHDTARLSRIVKLKYRKRQAKDIHRILAMKSRPRQEPLAAGPITKAPPPASVPPQVEDKKRPRPVEDQPESSSKRSKIPNNIEIPKARTPLQPPFKSPTIPSNLNPQKVFGTPKKGDAMKSVAMRKVDSGDGHARTPQPMLTSAPASAEKPRINGSDPRFAEMEMARAAYPKYLTLGTNLKRQTDQILKTREWIRTTVSEAEKKLSAVVAVECLSAYMAAFHAHDTKAHLERKPNHGEGWTSFFQLVPFVTALVKPHPELHILVLLLSGSCSDALDKLHSDRFATETPSGEPEYLKFRDEYVKNTRYRFKTWPLYHELCKLEGRNFKPETQAVLLLGKQGIPIPEVKSLAKGVLKEWSGVQDISWDMKIDF